MMLQRICDRCGKIIDSGIGVKINDLPPDICLVHLDFGPFKNGHVNDENITRKTIIPSETKKYELCKDCKEMIILWLTNWEETDVQLKLPGSLHVENMHPELKTKKENKA